MIICDVFSNLSAGLPTPLYNLLCSSTAFIALSLFRPNALVVSLDRYFTTGHLAQEIHALLHIKCAIGTTKTLTTSL